VIEALPAGIETWLFTSGVQLDAHRLERWQRRITGYAVSLDGTRDQHNALRRSVRSFDDIIAFLKRLSALGLRIQLQSMVLRRSPDYFPSFIELAELLGVERILFSHVSPDGRGELLWTDHMRAAELDRLFEHVRSLQSSTPVLLRTNLMPKMIVQGRFPKPTLHVFPTGEVAPWFGASTRHALAHLYQYDWDLQDAFAASEMPADVDGAFRSAKHSALNYPGNAVPVDDLIVGQLRRIATCV
jgi:hypothetical protein